MATPRLDDQRDPATGPAVREPAPVPHGAEPVQIAMRDGTRLAADVYLPAGRGPFPAIVTRLPYDKAHPENMVEFIAGPANERGYAVVAQDTRGKFRSEGTAAPFEHEALDGYDTLDWVARQSWCRGADVAMWGASYFGYTQWAALAAGHPSLRAIVPTTTTSMIGQDWIWRQGVFELGFVAGWCAITWMGATLHDWDLELPWSVRPLTDVVPSAFGGRRCAALERLARLGPHDPYWMEATYLGRQPALESSVPALHVGGWWDVFSRGQIADWALASRVSGRPQHLVMDAVDHYMGEWSAEPDGIPDFEAIGRADLEAYGEASMQAPLDFLDHVLRGRHRALPPVSWRLTHEDWRIDDRWPPSGSRPMSWYLTTGAGLAPDRPSAGRWAFWTHDPEDLVPTLGMAHGLTDLLVPPDDAALEHRPDVLVFTTEPFAEPLDLSGPVRAELQVASSAPAMHVIVRLIDVFPDGRTRRIRDGAALALGAEQEPHVVVDLGPTGYRVLPGHRLRVHVCSSDFPRYLPYFGDDRDPWTAVDGVCNAQRVRVGGQHAARIVLTVL